MMPASERRPQPQPMFPSEAERLSGDQSLSELITQSLRRVNTGPVGPRWNPKRFADELEQIDFQAACQLPELLQWVVTQMERGIVHVTHPRYFGLFNPAPTYAAECADRIVAAFNPQLASSITSPAAVAIEAHTIRLIADRLGLPPGSGGSFTTGGSEANLTAALCALTALNPRYADAGLRSFDRAPTIYVSADAHLAWCKIAHQIGLGRDLLRFIPTDPSGRLDAAALCTVMASDRSAGLRPALVVATAGTTGAGMVDPIARCERAARAHGAWFHVDAAWGGAVVVSDRLRWVLNGIQTADSITIDGHKWFATTMACGMFLVRDSTILSQVFGVDAAFMPSKAAQLDPYMTTAQWSRRFLGLRLFVALGAMGWQGYAAHVEKAVDLAALAKAELVSRRWRHLNDSRMAVLCVIPPPGSVPVAEIVERVVASNQAWVSRTCFSGEDTVRICISNGTTSANDVLSLCDLLDRVATEKSAADAGPPQTREEINHGYKPDARLPGNRALDMLAGLGNTVP